MPWEGRAKQVASGSNEVYGKCGLHFANGNNTTTVRQKLPVNFTVVSCVFSYYTQALTINLTVIDMYLTCLTARHVSLLLHTSQCWWLREYCYMLIRKCKLTEETATSDNKRDSESWTGVPYFVLIQIKIILLKRYSPIGFNTFSYKIN